MKLEIVTVPMDQVEVWKKNLEVRATKQVDYERTKREIEELGVIKPVVGYKENGKYWILGGRLRFFVLKDMGHKKIDISVRYPKTEAEKWKILLADNDQPSRYVLDALAERIWPYKEEIKLENYKIDVAEPESLKKVIESYGPESEEERSEVEFSEELLLEHNYIILYFDNPLDWQVARTKFKLKTVRDLIPRKNQPTGVGRVVNGKEWLDKIHA